MWWGTDGETSGGMCRLTGICCNIEDIMNEDSES